MDEQQLEWEGKLKGGVFKIEQISSICVCKEEFRKIEDTRYD